MPIEELRIVFYYTFFPFVIRHSYTYIYACDVNSKAIDLSDLGQLWNIARVDLVVNCEYVRVDMYSTSYMLGMFYVVTAAPNFGFPYFDQIKLMHS